MELPCGCVAAEASVARCCSRWETVMTQESPWFHPVPMEMETASESMVGRAAVIETEAVSMADALVGSRASRSAAWEPLVERGSHTS